MTNINKFNMSCKAYVVIKSVNIMLETDDPEMLEVMFQTANKRLRDIYIAKKAGFKDGRKKEML